jgi:hypothetical protein
MQRIFTHQHTSAVARKTFRMVTGNYGHREAMELRKMESFPAAHPTMIEPAGCLFPRKPVVASWWPRVQCDICTSRNSRRHRAAAGSVKF